MAKPELYHCSNPTAWAWPDTPDGNYAQRYLEPLMQNSPQYYISNIHTQLMALHYDKIVLPLTVTTYHPTNSYVCSPYNHYISYGQEELTLLRQPALELILKLFLQLLGGYLWRNGFDKVVFVNNWLLSTNIYPSLQPNQIVTILAYLVQLFPDRPIIFRSVDNYGSPQLYQTLLNFGCEMLFSRQIYYQDPVRAWRKKQVKIDYQRLRRTPYQVLSHTQITPTQIPRITELYHKLYLQKYSYFNPQFSGNFVKLAIDHDLFHFKALTLDGRIDGVIGYYQRNGIMTCPLLGYDTQLPQKMGLYVLLTVLVTLEGLKHSWLVNKSSGVGAFKRPRGGIGVLEYNAVYTQHLSPRQQRPWQYIKQLLNHIVIPMIQRYGF